MYPTVYPPRHHVPVSALAIVRYHTTASSASTACFQLDLTYQNGARAPTCSATFGVYSILSKLMISCPEPCTYNVRGRLQATPSM